MKPKRYKLLKDLPDLKAGTVFAQNQYGDYINEGHINVEGDKQMYRGRNVEENPDWFQLIEEKEFTKMDLYSFASFWFTQCPGYGKYRDPESSFQQWLTQRNNNL